jgi:polyphenol oxidase
LTAGGRAGPAVATPPLPSGVRTVRESLAEAVIPLHVHPEWRDDLPWLVQGTTGRGADGGFDLGLFGASPVGATLRRWRALGAATGMPSQVHSRQVHGREVRVHEAAGPGLTISDGFDGHVTARPGLLLTVSVADCVPISIVDASARRVALLHGGWRGTARGILAAGLQRMDSRLDRVMIHLGPAICGRCYEVGPEVHEALGLPVPSAAGPADVRAVLADQAVRLGVDPDHVTVSGHCTRCGPHFFSHRAGHASRQAGILGIRP